MAKYLPKKTAAVVLLIVVLGIAFTNDIKLSLILIIFTVFLFWVIRKLMMQRIGGMTGDTAGAMIELVETAVLVVMVFIQL